MAAGVAAAGTVAIAGPSAADQVATWIMPNGMRAVNVGALSVNYQGRMYSWDQIEKLQADGHAKVTVMDWQSAQDGKAHAFDTGAEADAWACANLPQMKGKAQCGR